MLDNTINKTVDVLQGLTQKIVIIKQKTDQCLTNENYIELNNKIDILSAMFNSNTNESDIVSLLNLPRPISEYTNDHIGEIISIPYNDDSGKILLNNGCIEFEVVGVNHHKDVNDETKPTITLMTKNIIRRAAFDAKEPNNPLYDYISSNNARANSGNNRWSQSNIRQWLNSSQSANSWFTAQHEYDEAPTADKVSNEIGAYANEPGFLAGFSPEVFQHFTDITIKTALCNLDEGGLETTVDKVFLPSYTEMFGSNNIGVAEGTHLSVKYSDDNSRVKSGANGQYWMRSPSIDSSGVCYVDGSGYNNYDSNYNGYINFSTAYTGNRGIAPLIVLH